MRARSLKRQRQEREYARLRKQYLEDHSRCGRCGQRATQIHHRRGRVGADLLREADWVALCHVCHVWVTERPTEATAAGLSASRIGVRA